jgi:hypothetical protein
MTRRAAVTVCLALSGLFGTQSAQAEKTKAPAPANRAEVDRLSHALDAGSEEEKLTALDDLGKLTGASAAPAAAAVSEVLRRGGSVPVLVRALEVSGKLAQPSSSAIVAPYTRHRTPELRLAATRALSTTGGPEATAALRALLHGDDGASRGLAASGLATLKAKDAVSDLFAVLAKDVPEAAEAIGQLCAPADCTKFSDYLGRLPFDLVQSGLTPILLRPESEVPAELKLEVLERLRKLQTDEARKFLQTVRASYPDKGNVQVKYGLDQAVENKPVLPSPSVKGKAK